MIKQLLTLLIFITGFAANAQGPYPPAAGVAGSTAISKDTAIIQTWASGIELQRGYIQISDTSQYNAGDNKASFGQAVNALGMAEGSSTEVVSLGDGGIATLTFDQLIVNGPGADFAVFENSFGDTFLELAFVEVSADGVNFIRFPSVSLTQTANQVGAWDELDPTNIHNLAGKYRQGFGTPFDLSDLESNPLVDVNAIRFVRITDVVGCIDPQYAGYDSQNNIINDPWPTPFNSCGFDLDGVAVINGGNPNPVVDFSELSLMPDSYFLPLETGSFSAGPLTFPYEAGTGFWSGFSYSSRVSLTGEYTNDQFVAVTRGSMQGDSTTFAMAYVASDWMSGTYDPIPSVVEVSDGQAVTFSGFYATNNEMAYVTMRDGTLYNKKFGGDTGNDPDWFRIKVWGVRADDSTTEPLEFYLADFRADDNSLDFIANDWRWCDLSSLGSVKSLKFVMESSDSGDYGINTPAYFCLDNLTVMSLQAPFVSNYLPDIIVPVNSQPVSIDLSSYFAAPANSISAFEVTENSNGALISAIVENNTLQLSFALNASGEANIGITATANGLTVTDSFRVEVNANVGIDEPLASRFAAYPNPCINQLTVTGAENAVLKLYNAAGYLVYEELCRQAEFILDVSSLPQGIYVLKAEGKNNNATLKIGKL